MIETDKIGNKDYKIFKYNTKLSTVEYYDIVASNYNYTFGNIAQILPNQVDASSQNITTRIVHLKPKYIMKNNSQYIITVVQNNTQKPSREIVLAKDDISPLFSNDGKLESPVVRFRVKNHGWSDKIMLE